MALWARRRPGMKRTATGTGLTNPPWHRIVSAPSAATPLTACGKRLRGAAERVRALTPPSDGTACPTCTREPSPNDLDLSEQNGTLSP